jgi:hypothetical protein
VVVKPAFAETCTRYDAAPVEAFHVSVGFVATPVVPFGGEANTGAGGIEGAEPAVVKLRIVEYALVPPLYAALTRQ